MAGNKQRIMLLCHMAGAPPDLEPMTASLGDCCPMLNTAEFSAAVKDTYSIACNVIDALA